MSSLASHQSAQSNRRLVKARIALLGGASVGKTAFVVRYITKRFIGEYDQSKEMVYTHKGVFDKDEISVEILDTSDTSDEQELDNNIKWGDGFILMYSVTDGESKERLQEIQRRVLRYKTQDAPLVIVANKTDLVHARMISEKDGATLAKSMNRPIFEISVAESAKAVNDVMAEVMRQVRQEFNKNLAAMEKRSTLLNMKRVLKKKLNRSRSDSVYCNTKMQWHMRK